MKTVLGFIFNVAIKRVLEKKERSIFDKIFGLNKYTIEKHPIAIITTGEIEKISDSAVNVYMTSKEAEPIEKFLLKNLRTVKKPLKKNENGELRDIVLENYPSFDLWIPLQNVALAKGSRATSPGYPKMAPGCFVTNPTPRIDVPRPPEFIMHTENPLVPNLSDSVPIAQKVAFIEAEEKKRDDEDTQPGRPSNVINFPSRESGPNSA